jgi:uncharacterized membrane protein
MFMDIAILSDQGNHFFRFLHILFGIAWIGLLYYFNFVQMEYFKEAEAGAKADAIQKLAPRALWWFRWAALFTFLTGVWLLHVIAIAGINLYIVIGAVLGTLMFLNVWGLIWPNQKVVIGLKEGDKAAAGARAGVASRTNTVFSVSMLLFMVSSAHVHGAGGRYVKAMADGVSADASMLALYVALAVIAALELNAIKGKMGPMASVNGVLGCAVGLAVILYSVVGLL